MRDRSPKNRGDENDSVVQKLTAILQDIGPDQGISPGALSRYVREEGTVLCVDHGA
jgi:hypothetical protein